MTTPLLEVLGTVQPDGTLKLDQQLTVPPGRFKVRLEPVDLPTPPTENLIEFVRRSRRELEAAGHKFRTKDEIDTEMEELRGEWDARPDELHCQQPDPKE